MAETFPVRQSPRASLLSGHGCQREQLWCHHQIHQQHDRRYLPPKQIKNSRRAQCRKEPAGLSGQKTARLRFDDGENIYARKLLLTPLLNLKV